MALESTLLQDPNIHNRSVRLQRAPHAPVKLSIAMVRRSNSVLQAPAVEYAELLNAKLYDVDFGIHELLGMSKSDFLSSSVAGGQPIRVSSNEICSSLVSDLVRDALIDSVDGCDLREVAQVLQESIDVIVAMDDMLTQTSLLVDSDKAQEIIGECRDEFRTQILDLYKPPVRCFFSSMSSLAF